MSIEQELTSALRREAPRAGFSDRVLGRIHEETSSAGLARAAYAGGWTRIAAAILLVVSTGLLSSLYVGQIRQEAAGERAKQELVVAMRIASEKTNLARQEIVLLGAGGVDQKGDNQ